MANDLEKIVKSAEALLKIGKALGPLLISQSTTVSEKLAEHKMRQANAEAYRELILSEAKAFAAIREKLLERYFSAHAEERVRLKRDIEEAEREARRLLVYQKAVEQLPPPSAQDEATKQVNTEEQSTEQPKAKEIELHWIDKFDELARSRNEPWRQDLLARALAREASEPGSVSPRALWFIGIVEEKAFHAFSALLNVSAKIAKRRLVSDYDSFGDLLIPTVMGPIQLGALVFTLTELDVVADPITTVTTFSPPKIGASYGSAGFLIACQTGLDVHGLALTDLGHTLSKLHQPTPNEVGLQMFLSWIAKLDKTRYAATPLHQDVAIKHFMRP